MSKYMQNSSGKHPLRSRCESDNILQKFSILCIPTTARSCNKKLSKTLIKMLISFISFPEALLVE